MGLLLVMVVILLIIFIARTVMLGSVVGGLGGRLDRLERALSALAADRQKNVAGNVEVTPQPAVLHDLSTGAPAPAMPTPALSASAPSADVPSVPAPALSSFSVATPSPLLKPAAPPSRTREEWEALIGGKLLNRIGALALLIGIGLFLKYAFDNDLINETTRVLIGVFVGVGCLFGAYRTQRKGYQVFAQGLAGAGIGILYLSGYASFNYYHIVSQPVAFGLLAALTMMSLEIGSRYDSFAVSVLGWTGGILTPLMLGTGDSNEPGLFGFLSFLNLGVLLVVLRKKTWMGLEVLALIGTYGWYLVWFTEYYTPSDLPLTLFFLALFWGIFHAYDLFNVLRGEAYLPDLRRLVATVHAVVMYAALSALLEAGDSGYAGLATLVAAILYAASAVLVVRRAPGEKGAIAQYTLVAVSLIAIAAAVQFERFTIIILWAAEACCLYWLGVKRALPFLRVAGTILFVVTGITLLALHGSLMYTPTEEFRVFLNIRAGTYLWFAATLAAAAIAAGRACNPDRPVEAEVFQYGWMAVLLILLTVETNDLFEFWKQGAGVSGWAYLGFSRLMVLSAVWSAYSLVLSPVWSAYSLPLSPAWSAFSLALSAPSRLKMTRSVLFSGMWLVLGAGCLAGLRGLSFEPLSTYTPVINIRFGVILFSVFVLVIHLHWSKGYSHRSDWIPDLAGVIRIMALSLLLVLLTSEVRDSFQKVILEIEAVGRGAAGSAEIARLENLEQLSLSSSWLFFSIVLMIWGIWKRSRRLRMMSILLFGIAILKIFIYDLSFLETPYRIGSFVGLGVILLSVSYLYQRYKTVILESGEGKVP
jgi:uncharacterized membrane protein